MCRCEEHTGWQKSPWAWKGSSSLGTPATWSARYKKIGNYDTRMRNPNFGGGRKAGVLYDDTLSAGVVFRGT